MRPRGIRTKQSGFTLMELIAFTAILAIVTAAAVPLVRDLQSTTEASIAGEQLRTIAEASGAYIKAHYSVLQAATGPATAAAVSIASLQAEGFLAGSASYIDPWRQTYTLYVLQPTAGNLLGVILTAGGRGAPVHSTLAEDVRFADVVVPSAARRAGAAGGFVSIGNIAGSVAGRLYGAAGGWQLDISTTNIPQPGPGHLAAVVYLASGQLVDDVLYRFAVPNNADANRMHVALDMNNNNINNAGSVNASSVHAVGTVSAGSITATSIVSAAQLSASDPNGLYVGRASVAAGLVGWSGLVVQLQPQVPLPGSTSVACSTPSSSWSYVAIPTNWMPSGGPQPLGGVRTRLEQVGGMYEAHMQIAISDAWQDADPSSQAWILILCGNGT